MAEDGQAEATRSLVVKNLPLGLDDTALWNYFESFATVEFAGVQIDPVTWESTGRGKVVFASEADLQTARSQPHFVDGKMIESYIAADGPPEPEEKQRRTYRIGRLAMDVTDEILYNYFTKHVGIIEHAKVVFDKEGNSRGFGNLVVADQGEESLASCWEALTRQAHFIRGKALEIRPDGTAPVVQDKDKELMVRGVPIELDDKGLYKYFTGRYGSAVIIARIAVEIDSGVSRGFGFVSFKKKSHVEKAIAQAHFINRKALELLRADKEKDEEAKASKAARTIVVGRLPSDIDDEGLHDYFAQWWELQCARIFRDRETGQLRDRGLVVFANSADAESSFEHPHFISGKLLTLQWEGEMRSDFDSRGAHKVVARGLPHTVTEEEVYNYLLEMPCQVTSVNIAIDRETGKSRGMAFINFASEADVCAVLRHAHVIGGKSIEMQAEGKDDRRLFVRGLPWDLEVERLHEYFSRFVGKVVSARLVINESTGESKGCAIVVLEDAAVAQKALEKPHTLDGQPLEMRLDDDKPDGKGSKMGKGSPTGNSEVRFKSLAEAKLAAEKLKEERREEKRAKKKAKHSAEDWDAGTAGEWLENGEWSSTVHEEAWSEEWNGAEDASTWAEDSWEVPSKKRRKSADVGQ